MKPFKQTLEAEPYIWAQEDEKIAKADCGCRIEVRDDGPAFYRCLNCVRAVNSHDELLKWVKWVRMYIIDNGDSYGKEAVVSELSQLIKMAEGK